MKRLLTILLTCLLVLPALAQGEGVKKVAILEVVDREGTVSYGVKLQLRSSLTAAITQTPGYEAYDRVDMAAIFGEHDFQRTGVVNDEQIKKLEADMKEAAKMLEFEYAAMLRDKIIELRGEGEK
ncbi:MAG: UvrB/UvrC motif-containing protein [Tidjanibacter sp.]|nr:UvrB/UvrC motif-containing protein [Tidjanibacter sp.]